MPFIGEGAAVRQVDEDRWELLDDLRYKGNRDLFVVPGGFETDFASVPRPFTWLIPRYGRYTREAVLHDHLCQRAREGSFSRADADGLFRRSLREAGVAFLRRWVMWTAVRLGGGWGALWSDGVGAGLLAITAALVSLAVLLVPALVVLAWMVAAWLLEWAVYPLVLATAGGEQVNKPRLLRLM